MKGQRTNKSSPSCSDAIPEPKQRVSPRRLRRSGRTSAQVSIGCCIHSRSRSFPLRCSQSAPWQTARAQCTPISVSGNPFLQSNDGAIIPARARSKEQLRARRACIRHAAPCRVIPDGSPPEGIHDVPEPRLAICSPMPHRPSQHCRADPFPKYHAHEITIQLTTCHRAVESTQAMFSPSRGTGISVIPGREHMTLMQSLMGLHSGMMRETTNAAPDPPER
ncbi:hypothetical protein CALVIDRAFT_150399 [Calocera viscosa TUFC12733]|uniref:Uncharacterized protein n=1 Tax=Calocera viscosa (strain TUFC12733) TaxID=1330018 RepID=A0A167LJ66_CALVF|nr:hypothetical protein CALVIDRAFT_150399 [Calocera viscosa TUFC12733]